MRGVVKKWGNSAAIRIPAAVLEIIQLRLNDEVDVREEAGRIVIEPVRQTTYRLDDLLKGISANNRHKTVDFGPAQGKEIR
jgi:antitoxin MazE